MCVSMWHPDHIYPSILSYPPPTLSSPTSFYPVWSTGFNRSYLYGQDCEAVHGHPNSSAVAAFLRSMTSFPTRIPKRSIALWAGLVPWDPTLRFMVSVLCRPTTAAMSLSAEAILGSQDCVSWPSSLSSMMLPGVGDMGIPFKVGTQQSLVLDNLASHESALQRKDLFLISAKGQPYSVVINKSVGGNLATCPFRQTKVVGSLLEQPTISQPWAFD